VDLSGTSGQVRGPLVYLTQAKIISSSLSGILRSKNGKVYTIITALSTTIDLYSHFLSLPLFQLSCKNMFFFEMVQILSWPAKMAKLLLPGQQYHMKYMNIA